MRQIIKAFIAITVLMTAFLTSKSQAGKPIALWQDWMNLWNGDYTVGKIISSDFRLHAVMLDGSSDTLINNSESLLQWIKQIRGALSDLKFTTEVGPLVSGKYIVGRWIATGVYEGGIPGAKANKGTVITFTGTDILRTHKGKIVEYWINSDTQSMLMQLKVY